MSAPKPPTTLKPENQTHIAQTTMKNILSILPIVSSTFTSSPARRSVLSFSGFLRGGSSANYTVLSQPAPGSPFHYAFPVHSLEAAKEFYGNILGCQEGRSSAKWQDYSLHGHQIVCHWVGDTYRCKDYYNPVDGDEVPVPRRCSLSM